MSEKERFVVSMYDVLDRENGRKLQMYEIIDLLNEQDEKIKELKKENEQLKKARDESDKFIIKKGLEAEFLNWVVENDE